MSELSKEQVEELIGRLKNVERLLNQIVPKPMTWATPKSGDLVLPDEAAEILGVSRDHLNRIGKNGELKRFKIEGTRNNPYWYSKKDIKDFILQRKNRR